jgi:hypothetical protein
MHEPDATDRLLRPRLRVLQMIAGALITGVLAFGVVVIVLVQQRGPAGPGANGPVLTYVALAFFAANAVVWSFLPARFAQKQVRDIAAGTWKPGPQTSAAAYPSDLAKLLVVLQTRTVIAYALLEGSAFLGWIAYLTEGDLLALAAVAGPLALMQLTFPTRLRVEVWLQRQQARLEELRQIAGPVG